MFKRLSDELPQCGVDILLVELGQSYQVCQRCVYINNEFDKHLNHNVYKFIDNNRNYIHIQDYLIEQYIWADVEQFIDNLNEHFLGD